VRAGEPYTVEFKTSFNRETIEAVEQAMKFIVSHISVAFEFDGSLQRNERFAYQIGIISNDIQKEFTEELKKISSMLHALIKSIKP